MNPTLTPSSDKYAQVVDDSAQVTKSSLHCQHFCNYLSVFVFVVVVVDVVLKHLQQTLVCHVSGYCDGHVIFAVPLICQLVYQDTTCGSLSKMILKSLEHEREMAT